MTTFMSLQVVPEVPTNLSHCWSKLKALDAQIDDAKKSLVAFSSEEVGELIPKGTLSVLDALREVEAKFLEDSPEEKARKRQARIDGVKSAIANLENERESVLEKQQRMEARCELILATIGKVGERALKAQEEFYQAIAELEGLKSLSLEYKQLKNSGIPPLEIKIGDEAQILTRFDSQRWHFHPITTYNRLREIYIATGVQKA